MPAILSALLWQFKAIRNALGPSNLFLQRYLTTLIRHSILCRDLTTCRAQPTFIQRNHGSPFQGSHAGRTVWQEKRKHEGKLAHKEDNSLLIFALAFQPSCICALHKDGRFLSRGLTLSNKDTRLCYPFYEKLWLLKPPSARRAARDEKRLRLSQASVSHFSRRYKSLPFAFHTDCGGGKHITDLLPCVVMRTHTVLSYNINKIPLFFYYWYTKSQSYRLPELCFASLF